VVFGDFQQTAKPKDIDVVLAMIENFKIEDTPRRSRTR
jgi:hypothetical protein